MFDGFAIGVIKWTYVNICHCIDHYYEQLMGIGMGTDIFARPKGFVISL